MKKLLAMLLAAMMVFTVVGCEQKPAATEEVTEETTEEVTEEVTEETTEEVAE